MKNVLPGVVTTPGSLVADQHSISNARVANAVKLTVKSALDGFIGVPNPKTLGTVIQTALQRLVAINAVRDVSVDDVEVGAQKPFKEVTDLDPAALPGDPVIVEEIQPDGSCKEDFQGIVISSDGHGNGVIFREPSAQDHDKV